MVSLGKKGIQPFGVNFFESIHTLISEPLHLQFWWHKKNSLASHEYKSLFDFWGTYNEYLTISRCPLFLQVIPLTRRKSNRGQTEGGLKVRLICFVQQAMRLITFVVVDNNIFIPSIYKIDSKLYLCVLLFFVFFLTQDPNQSRHILD